MVSVCALHCPMSRSTVFAFPSSGRETGTVYMCAEFIVKVTFFFFFASQIVSQYSVHRQSAYLYLGSILVDECASEPQCVDELIEMVSDFIQPTFALLQVRFFARFPLLK